MFQSRGQPRSRLCVSVHAHRCAFRTVARGRIIPVGEKFIEGYEQCAASVVVCANRPENYGEARREGREAAARVVTAGSDGGVLMSGFKRCSI